MNTVEALIQSAATRPVLLFLAGSNGAGKSTYHKTFLSGLGLEFVNADVIAKGLEVTEPDLLTREKLGQRQALARQAELLSQHASFCMETVFSDPAKAKLDFMREAQAEGYAVIMVFIGIASAMLSQLRVVQRVESGGHDVPEDRIRDRFPRTLENLQQAVKFVDRALLYDNSSPALPYQFVALYELGELKERGTLQPSWAAGLIRE